MMTCGRCAPFYDRTHRTLLIDAGAGAAPDSLRPELSFRLKLMHDQAFSVLTKGHGVQQHYSKSNNQIHAFLHFLVRRGGGGGRPPCVAVTGQHRQDVLHSAKVLVQQVHHDECR